jgi:hypothetical protein
VYSSHDLEHDNAIALKDYLQARIGKKRVSQCECCGPRIEKGETS